MRTVQGLKKRKKRFYCFLLSTAIVRNLVLLKPNSLPAVSEKTIINYISCNVHYLNVSLFPEYSFGLYSCFQMTLIFFVSYRYSIPTNGHIYLKCLQIKHCTLLSVIENMWSIYGNMVVH
jgi:hypothetical protein